jgi:hypothetical protein
VKDFFIREQIQASHQPRNNLATLQGINENGFQETEIQRSDIKGLQLGHERMQPTFFRMQPQATPRKLQKVKKKRGKFHN